MVFSTICGLLGGVATSLITTYSENESVQSLTWWQSLLIALIPVVLGGIFDIILAVLKNKKAISDEDAENIAEKVEEGLEKIQSSSTITTTEETTSEDKSDDEQSE